MTKIYVVSGTIGLRTVCAAIHLGLERDIKQEYLAALRGGRGGAGHCQILHFSFHAGRPASIRLMRSRHHVVICTFGHVS